MLYDYNVVIKLSGKEVASLPVLADDGLDAISQAEEMIMHEWKNVQQVRIIWRGVPEYILLVDKQLVSYVAQQLQPHIKFWGKMF